MTITATVPCKLRPRHRRVEVPHFEITERDLTALKQIWRYRLIATPELIALIALEHSVGESERWIKNRLQLLYHGRFVDRLPVPLHHPDVYALGTHGAALLEARFGIMRPRTGWRDRSEEHAIGIKITKNIQHTLDIARTMSAFEVSVFRHPEHSFVSPEDIVTTVLDPARLRSNPYSWQVPMGEGEEPVVLVPDKVFGIQTVALPEGKNRRFYMLEEDQGTEPVVRSAHLRRRQTSFSDKLSAYRRTLDLWHADGSERYRPYAFRHFQVLTVTTTRARMEHLIAENKRLSDGVGWATFLFTDKETRKAYREKMLELPWVNGKGETVRLGA